MAGIVFCIAMGVVVQEAALVVDSAAGIRGPVAVSCGLIGEALDPKVPWKAVRLRGDRGMSVPGILARAPFGVLVRTVVPGLAPGRTTLLLDRGTQAGLPGSTLALRDGGGSWESEGWSAAFEADGTITVLDRVCRLSERRARDGKWREWDRDPLRSVIVWEAPGVTLYAVLCAGVPAIDLTLVLRGVAAGSPAALGFEIAAVGEDGPPAAPPESRPADSAVPPFDVVMQDLASSPCESIVLGGSRIGVSVRRHGPTAPLAVQGDPGRSLQVLMVEAPESLSAGEPRVLRLRLQDGVGADVRARPARFPPAWPGGARFGPPSRCRDLARLSRQLAAAVGVFRTDPRHGLLHAREDLGDWRMDRLRFGNLEWDTSLGFLLRFLDGGDGLDGAQAVLGVEHLLLRDRDPATGLFFQHGPEHQSGILEPGHHWAEGVAAVASWLGDPWIIDETRQLARDQIAAFGALDLASALPRSVAWALTALCALHDFAADQRASAKLISKIERFVLARQSDAGHFMLERSTAHEGGFRVSPFVDGGILIPALERAALITRHGRTAGAVRAAREALLRDGVVPEPDGPVLVSSILIEGKSGRVISRAGRAEGEEIALFVSGVAAGGSDGALSGLVRRAEDSLTLDERTCLGKGISMLMRALPAYAARRGSR